ncbi:MAG: hypothetical protein SVY53_05075 [Chloroflexota bacterium]|nr:hypothetical protein [Chloroflexota bacterium]
MIMRMYPFFAYASGPAEGLTLSDIAITILRVARTDKSVTKVVDAVPAQAEIGKGYYAYFYDATDLESYDYLPFVEYTGAEPVNPSFYAGDLLDVTVAGGLWGPGAIEWTYTLTEEGTGTPIPDAQIWVTTDLVGSHVIASGMTDQNGQIKFYLDAGEVYIFRAKAGYNFANPDTEVIS